MKRTYLFILPTAVILSSCNAKSPSYVMPMSSAPTYANISQEAVAMPMPVRKIAMSASIDVEVESITNADKALNKLIQHFNGHVENTRLSENGYYSADIKVPSDKLVLALDAIAKLGEKTAQSINKRDITKSFINNEERLKNLKMFREKMKILLDRTSNIEEILRIERELNRVQTEIDMIERQLKSMQGSVDMSPINVSLEEKTIYGPVGYVGKGLWWAVKKLFVIR